MTLPVRLPSSIPAVGVVLLALAASGCKEDKQLKVTGIEPAKGDFAGGTRVTIKGNRFTKDGQRNAKVYFGDCATMGDSCRPARVLGFRGDSELLVQTPGGNVGDTVDVLIIFEPGGEITLKDKFTYIQETQAGVEDLDIKKAGDKK